ncbi:MAG: WD40 repeat domain-containing serine/threonine protein kinase [Hyphomicrobiaceae bacterium]
MTNLLALPTGTMLADDYRIERVLGAGGFGITYLAEEQPLARRITIKEYFPADYAARDGAIDASPRSQDCAGDYTWGLDRFLEEAQTLARFDHPNIVRVYRYFRANKTGYMVLHFEEGQSFKSWLKSLGRAPRQNELDRIIAPLLDALELIHNADFLHRDIAPDNIIIRKDGSPVLIDFGSARGEIAQHSMTVSALVKPGYSAYEQYATTSRQQGPWSDIYSLGATLYQAVTGKRPPDAPSRMITDEMVPARDAALSSYRPTFLAAIDKALKLEISQRPKSIALWRKELLEVSAAAEAAVETPPPKPAAAALAGRIAQQGKAAKAPAAAPKALLENSVAVIMRLFKGEEPVADALAKPAKPKARAKVISAPPIEVKPKAKTAKSERRVEPRPMRSKRRWRPLAIKLMIGLGVASAAVAMQDHFPVVDRRGPITGSTQSASPALPVTAQMAAPPVVSQFKGHSGPVKGVAFAGDGRWIVSTGGDSTVKIWNASTRTLVRTVTLDAGAATALAAEGRRAVSGHKDGSVSVWDLDAGEKVATFKRNDAMISAVTFMGTQDRFAASAHDGAVTLFDVAARGGAIPVLEGHEGAADAMAYSSGGGYLASGGADRTIKLWNAASYSLMRTYRGHNDAVTALALTTDGRLLASASLDGAVRLWSTSSGRTFRSVRLHKARVSVLAFSPDGQMLASASEDGSVRLWEFRRARGARVVAALGTDVRSLSFSPDGRRLASAGGDGIVRLWEVAGIRQGP